MATDTSETPEDNRPYTRQKAREIANATGHVDVEIHIPSSTARRLSLILEMIKAEIELDTETGQQMARLNEVLQAASKFWPAKDQQLQILWSNTRTTWDGETAPFRKR